MKREEENKMNPKSIQFSDLKVYDWNQRLQKLISPQQLLGKVKSWLNLWHLSSEFPQLFDTQQGG